MLFNCLCCAKTISSKTDQCPYCQFNVGRLGMQIERAKQRPASEALLSELRGTVAKIRLSNHGSL